MSEKLTSERSKYNNFFEVDGVRFRGCLVRDVDNSLGACLRMLDKHEIEKIVSCLRVNDRQSVWHRFFYYYFAGLREEVTLEIDISHQGQEEFLKDICVYVDGVCYWLRRDEDSGREVDLNCYNIVFRRQQDTQKIYKIGKIGLGISLSVTIFSCLALFLIIFAIPYLLIPTLAVAGTGGFLGSLAVAYYSVVIHRYKNGGAWREMYERENNGSKEFIGSCRI